MDVASSTLGIPTEDGTMDNGEIDENEIDDPNNFGKIMCVQ